MIQQSKPPCDAPDPSNWKKQQWFHHLLVDSDTFVESLCDILVGEEELYRRLLAHSELSLNRMPL